MLGRVLGILWVVAFTSAGWAQERRLPPPVDREIDFTRGVDPIFERKCYVCHGLDNAMNGYSLWRRKEAMRGGHSGIAAIVEGDSAGSRLIQLVAGFEENLVMPPAGGKLTDEEIGTLRASEDRMTVFLDIEDLRPVDQMQVDLNIRGADGTPIAVELSFTVNKVEAERGPEVLAESAAGGQ